MDRFQKKIQREIKKHQPSFEEWYAENRGKLGAIEESSADIPNGNTLIRSRKIWLSVVVAVLFLSFCLAVILPLLLNRSDNNFDFTFSEEDVYSVKLTDEEFAAIGDEYVFIKNMQLTSGDALMLNENDALVMAVIRGEVETEENYYLLTVQIEYDNNYLFGYKRVYENLKYHKVNDEWSITYDNGLVDADGLYVYFIRMENEAEQVVYIEVHSFENDINYILNEFIA